MNFNTVDLHKELKKVKSKEKIPLVEEVDSILKQGQEHDKAIYNRFKKSGQELFIESEFDENNIFTLDQIKSICIKYRLRFLDSKRFKGEIPYEAVSKIKQLEREKGAGLNGFKIIAPKKLFQLDDKDADPLLFLQLSENKFYFIHKWGRELNLFRSLIVMPFRSFMNMFWFLVGVAFFFSLAVPTQSIDVFAFLFVHSFIAICGIACMLIFMFRENFSDVEWDSKFLS